MNWYRNSLGKAKRDFEDIFLKNLGVWNSLNVFKRHGQDWVIR